MNDAPDFLAKIIECKRQRLARAREGVSLEELRAEAWRVRRDAQPHALRAALSRDDRLNVIAELKRASPSKGELKGDVKPAALARDYQAGGAAAVSVLTEEDHFRGSLDDLREVHAAVALPVLRKDFIIDERQVYEAAYAGASALLLIVAALDDMALAHLLRLTEDELGMDALVEVHDEAELRRAESCGASIVGVNNRNLRTFKTTLDTSIKLATSSSSGALLVSESGLQTNADLRRLHALGYRGFLIGETLMRSADPVGLLRALLGSGGQN